MNITDDEKLMKEMRSNMIHELKIEDRYFNDDLEYGKSFEVRKDDRPYKIGDYLWMRKWDGATYSGEEILAKVRYIYRGELCKDGYCIMAIEVLDSWIVDKEK